MASSLPICIILAILFPAIVSAKQFIVGDGKGWTTNFDYQAWAQGKYFRVGDILVFQYPAGAHNVFKVNGTGFQQCIKPPINEALTSGNDRIVLATPGRKWYICGVGQHCAVGGQKLFINVNPALVAPSAAPSQAIGSGKEFIVGDGHGWTPYFDYQAWAQGKDFRVGDALVFKYPAGAHNVFKVNGTGFQQCIKPPASEALTSGYDRIVLATPGRKWYICGVSQHCAAGGQKLFINVNPAITAPSAAPSQPTVSANQFVVGDSQGWTTYFDYQAWARGKDFRVGDTLVFQYPVGAHNVFKVNGTGFQQCIKPPVSEALTSGNDKIVLATPGRKWYICGVGQHCAAAGQKLFINVNPAH
ncbi:hypothetical protein RJ639_011829 [Escallonia herrerae]|uniref:Phytocyanin domain-containing protein n=1 Tax=Escallonia herrerae TaxID=1293975 RepID=A0AA88VMG5_9ASTE|nr:hypothetical protein RJ639_011829 [Escallonia herrerae]